jgi:dihydroorotase
MPNKIMKTILILNAKIINEGQNLENDILIKGDRIEKIGKDLSGSKTDKVIDGKGNYLMPGIIDDQVHFREPGLTHKANIHSESRAAVAGGTTSFMEMPNTKPPTLTQEDLELKYDIALSSSLANYSFYMGASNDNLEEVLKTDPINVCGIKVFMGSSTGNMLVDDAKILEQIFNEAPMLVATHCEDEATIRRNMDFYRDKYGKDIPIKYHPLIRSEEACFLSSDFAVSLAKRSGTKLHVLHISTASETSLFDNDLPLQHKKITAEACIHHLWFDDRDYESKGALIKWNPAIKSGQDKDAVFQALLDDRIDVVATDHAPHLMEEKNNSYFDAPSGGPLVQHSLNAMLEFCLNKKISIEKVVEKMCHNPAILFQLRERGFIREGYYADLVLVDLNKPWKVEKHNILYKCGWSPFEGQIFRSQVTHTLVSGHLAYENGTFDESKKGMRLTFDR